MENAPWFNRDWISDTQPFQPEGQFIITYTLQLDMVIFALHGVASVDLCIIIFNVNSVQTSQLSGVSRYTY